MASQYTQTTAEMPTTGGETENDDQMVKVQRLLQEEATEWLPSRDILKLYQKKYNCELNYPKKKPNGAKNKGALSSLICRAGGQVKRDRCRSAGEPRE